MLEFSGFITVSANRSVFVPREQCSADWTFREFSPFLLTAADLFASSSSLFMYLSLESIRMIRIIRRISGRTSYLYTWSNTRHRAGPATRSNHRCSGNVASNTRRTRSEKRIGKNVFFFLTHIWQGMEWVRNRTFFSLLTFNISLLDEVPTSETLREKFQCCLQYIRGGEIILRYKYDLLFALGKYNSSHFAWNSIQRWWGDLLRLPITREISSRK